MKISNISDVIEFYKLLIEKGFEFSEFNPCKWKEDDEGNPVFNEDGSRDTSPHRKINVNRPDESLLSPYFIQHKFNGGWMGVPKGTRDAGGCLCIDLDSKKVPERLQKYFDGTVRSDTGKGHHLYVLYEGEFDAVKRSFEVEGRHVDLAWSEFGSRGTGAYCVPLEKVNNGVVTHIMLGVMRDRKIMTLTSEDKNFLANGGDEGLDKDGKVTKQTGTVKKSSNTNRKSKSATIHNRIPYEFMHKGEGTGRHHVLLQHIRQAALRADLDYASMLKWAERFNDIVFEYPKTNDEIKLVVDSVLGWVEQQGQKKEDRNKIFVPWKYSRYDLKKAKGLKSEILFDGFQKLGIEFRVNVRKDCLQVKGAEEYINIVQDSVKFNQDDESDTDVLKNEWKTLGDREITQLGVFASRHFVTGLDPFIKRPEGAPPKDKKSDEYEEYVKKCKLVLDDPLFIEWKDSDIQKVILTLACKNVVDPLIVDYFEKLPKWDGVERLYGIFYTAFKIDMPDDPEEAAKLKNIIRIAVRSLFLGMLERTYNPGSKHDEVVTLVSEEQGVGKSSFCEEIAISPQFFKDGFDWASKEKVYVEETMFKFIVEASENVNMSLKTIDHINSMTAKANATTRLSYRTNAEDYPARHGFMSTQNNRKFLPYYPKGIRRFICIDVGMGEMPPEIYIPEIRDQLWAEAKHYYKLGDKGKTTAEDIQAIKDHSIQFMMSPPFKDVINEALNKFHAMGLRQFTQEQFAEYLEYQYDIDREKNDHWGRMGRSIKESGKVNWEKEGKNFTYTFLKPLESPAEDKEAIERFKSAIGVNVGNVSAIEGDSDTGNVTFSL